MNIVSRHDIAQARADLTNAVPETERQRVQFYERVLCIIFDKQFSLRSQKCFALRKTLVDMWTEAAQRGGGGQ